jgi:NADPH:quinone reductase-like Zn-dependent oxidoreductase
MKAVRIHDYGDASVLRYEDVPMPTMQPHDVLIRVVATSFNPVDAKIRQGLLKAMMPLQLPLILGWDCAGVVEQVGVEVKKFKIGDEVFAMCKFERGGTYAEYVAVDTKQVALKPRTLSFVETAALPMVSQTALTALRVAGLKAGQAVLIHGGAGGVGTMAIQMAKSLGARVITTASGPGVDLVKSLGADEVIDYKVAKFREVVKEVDVVLDLIGGQTQEDSWGVLKKGGILVATAVPPAKDKAEQYGVRAEFIFTQPSGEALEEIAGMVDSGKVRAVISAEIVLANARQAHEAKGGNGKTVIRVG